LPNRVQTLRSNTPGNRPPAGQAPGSLYVNWPDGQLGVINSGGSNQDLLAVRFFSATTSYNIGDHVFYQGSLYKATAAIAPGAFNANQWTAVGGSITISDAAPSNPQPGSLWWDSVGGNLYVYYNDGTSSQWVVAVNIIGAYLPMGGGNLTGPLAAPSFGTAGGAPVAFADPPPDDVSAALATTNWIAKNVPSISSGFVNKLNNGAFDIWQRGVSVNAPVGNTYTADGWIVTPAGAAVVVTQGPGPASAATAAGPTLQSMQVAGAAGNTALAISQRIEASTAAPLGATVTFQAWVLNNSGATITPQLQISHPNTVDTSPYSLNDLNPVALQPCPNVAWTRVSYTFAISQASLNLGIQLTLMFGALTSGYIRLSAADLRATPGWPVGLCVNPPSPELRSIGLELLACQRYYIGTLVNYASMFSGNITSGGNYYAYYKFPTRMRVLPTVVATTVGQSSGFPTVSGTIAPYLDGFVEYRVANAAVTAAFFGSYYTASAEL